jgi:choline dehydrogenase-like flavoprotein
MLQDARSIAPGERLDADLCVIGSGPAGLALVQELRGSGLRILVLESGGLEESARRNDLSRLDSDSLYGSETRIENTRRVGGNANVWHIETAAGRRNVRMVPYTRADFQPREAVGSPGWPIDYDAYMGWIRRAQDHLDLPPATFHADEAADLEARPFPLEGSGIETHLFRFPNAEAYLERCRRWLRSSDTVRLVSYAHTLELISSASGGTIEEAVCASEPGREFTVRARRFVLAGGGLAVPQLMLSSRRVSGAGVGNAHDTVGRWFMDHPLIDGGEIEPASREVFDRAGLYDLRSTASGALMGFLAPSQETVLAEALLNINLILLPAERDFRRTGRMTPRQSLGVYSATRVRDALRHRHLPLLRDVVGVVSGGDGVVSKLIDSRLHSRSNLSRGGWSQLSSPSRRFDVFEVLHLAEQPPRRENRVTLGAERDSFGRPRVKVEWTFSDEDVAALARTQDHLARRFEASGLGRWTVRRVNGRPDIRSDSTGHFLGATRMHRDPRQGVTTPDARVHGVDNLYIASSSLFPTGGYANPTLSIMALAIGLADHLKAA